MTDGDAITVAELPSVLTDGRELPAQAIPQIGPAPMASVEFPEVEGLGAAPEANPDGGAGESRFSLDAAIREASKDALVRALNATHGNCHRAADLLGVSRYTVYRMLARYGLSESRGYRSWRKTTA